MIPGCGKAIDWDAPPRTRWSFSVDHVIPRSKGGDPYGLANCVTAHYGCNSRKKDRMPGQQQAPQPPRRRW